MDPALLPSWELERSSDAWPRRLGVSLIVFHPTKIGGRMTILIRRYGSTNRPKKLKFLVQEKSLNGCSKQLKRCDRDSTFSTMDETSSPIRRKGFVFALFSTTDKRRIIVGINSFLTYAPMPPQRNDLLSQGPALYRRTSQYCRLRIL